MKTSIACIVLFLGGIASAQAETRAQKLRYIHDLRGTSCTASNGPLAVHTSGGAVSGHWPAGSMVTIAGGKVDGRGVSWV